MKTMIMITHQRFLTWITLTILFLLTSRSLNKLSETFWRKCAMWAKTKSSMLLMSKIVEMYWILRSYVSVCVYLKKCNTILAVLAFGQYTEKGRISVASLANFSTCVSFTYLFSFFMYKNNTGWRHKNNKTCERI